MKLDEMKIMYGMCVCVCVDMYVCMFVYVCITVAWLCEDFGEYFDQYLLQTSGEYGTVKKGTGGIEDGLVNVCVCWKIILGRPCSKEV